MELESRKRVRNNVLRQAYIHFFDLNGQEKQSKLNLEDSYEKEIYLAMLYLSGKNLMHVKPKQNSLGECSAIITSLGIDMVENDIGLKFEEK